MTGVFYPPPPELPRVQFLTSFSGRKDVESQTAFNRFVVGEQPDVKLDKPYGVAIHAGKVYVCDTNATVVVFDLAKRAFAPLAGATGPGQLLAPVNVSIEPDGTKYVADPARGQVVVFDRDDQYVRAYGTPGGWRPVDALAYGDRLYVVDGANAAVRVFDKASGEQVKSIGDGGEPEQRLNRPTNLAFDGKGHLFVSDVGRFQVVAYDRDGHFRGTVGKIGDNLGHFARPKGIAIDRQDRLLAVDASFGNVQVFDRGGHLLLFFGAAGSEPGQLQLPAKVTIDYDNLEYFRPFAAPGFELEYVALVTSQFGPRLVNVFGYGRERGRRYPSDDELQAQVEERRRRARERLEQSAPAPAPATEAEPAAPQDPSPRPSPPPP
jgi:DNA-binding beta-propeller fold protein YncE